MRKVIALLTDFGTRDWYVGAMKGVIRQISTEADIIDLSHHAPGYEIRTGAMMLASAYTYYPEKTVFCCVIDPGVGSDRPVLIASDERYTFVAPDNGLLTMVAKDLAPGWRVYKATNRDYFLDSISSTFHGRDIFAPVSAHLANGVRPDEIGEPYLALERFPWYDPRILDKSAIKGEIIYVDLFGNLFTNIKWSNLESMIDGAGNPENWLLQINESSIRSLATTFSDRRAGEGLFYWGSSGYLEIAVNQGNAAEAFRAGVGTPVSLMLD